MKPRFITSVLVAVMALLLLSSGCAKKKEEATSATASSQEAADPAGTPANGVNGARTAAKDIEAFGIVKAKNARNISLDFPAVLEKKLVSEGQRVKAGDVLFRFSTEDYDSQISAKTLELEAARFDLKKAQIERQKLEEDLQIARTDVEKAEKDFKAKQDLYVIGAVSQNDVEDYRKALTTGQQRVRELTRSLEQYSAVDINSLDMQRARIANLERDLARLKNEARRSYISGNAIVADVRDGIVSEIGYAEGDPISKDRKLCSLMDLENLIVEANVPEEFVRDIRVGSTAEVVPLADNSKTYKGTVSRISGIAVKVNGETVVPVEITVERPDDFLRPNFNVDVKIH